MDAVDDIFNFILQQWQKNHLELVNVKRQDVPKLTKNLIELINGYLNSPPVYTQPPAWLADIDAYFQDQYHIRQQNKYSGVPYYREFVSVCTVLAPLVYFDDILRMHSFNDEFIHSMELSFLMRLNIPRDISEARRIYEAILLMPDTCHLVSQVIDKVVEQPFRAQMLFASLIMRKTEPQSELWRFQRECLENCPAKLLDYPGYDTDAYSFKSLRPAFYMGNFVDDAEFRHILQRRASQAYRDELVGVQEREQKQQNSQAMLATSHEFDIRSVPRLIADQQQQLVADLKVLDNFLSRLPPDRSVRLRTGVYPDQIDKLNQALAPLKIPQDLAELYQWHNSFEYGGYLFGVPDFLIMEDALIRYRDEIKLGEEFSWSKVFYPLCYGGKGYRLVILSEMTHAQTPVYLFYHEEGLLTQQFDSIQSMIETYVEAYSTNVIFYNVDYSYWDINEEDFELLQRRHNPESFTEDGSAHVYDIGEMEDWPEEWKKYYIGEPP